MKLGNGGAGAAGWFQKFPPGIGGGTFQLFCFLAYLSSSKDPKVPGGAMSVPGGGGIEALWQNRKLNIDS